LRIYNATLHHEHISFQAFSELKGNLARHTLNFLKNNPGQGNKTYTNGIYFNKVLKCGIVVCKNTEALHWYKEAIDQIGDQKFRGWTKEEQVTTCIKFFVPPGLETITLLEYLEATRIMYDTETSRGIPWTMLKEYIHHTKHTRIIIATIPVEIFTIIQTHGSQTSASSGVWKAIGFMGPLKLTVASENDLRHPGTTKPKHNITIQNSPNTSPPSSPSHTITVDPQEGETSPEKPAGLLHETNPLLSASAGSMSPLHVAMDTIAVSTDNEEVEGSGTTQEEDMDYGLLASPARSDTDDFSASWADQS
jgi:hypothetical protein